MLLSYLVVITWVFLIGFMVGWNVPRGKRLIAWQRLINRKLKLQWRK